MFSVWKRTRSSARNVNEPGRELQRAQYRDRSRTRSTDRVRRGVVKFEMATRYTSSRSPATGDSLAEKPRVAKHRAGAETLRSHKCLATLIDGSSERTRQPPHGVSRRCGRAMRSRRSRTLGRKSRPPFDVEPVGMTGSTSAGWVFAAAVTPIRSRDGKTERFVGSHSSERRWRANTRGAGTMHLGLMRISRIRQESRDP